MTAALDRARLAALDRAALWAPQPGPQLQAFLSPADQLLYGGAAGGGKTQLAIGLAVTSHQRTLFLRQEGKQLLAVLDELAGLLRSRDGYNGQTAQWRIPGVLERLLEFGGLKNLGDEQSYQGRPHDLIVFDEAANMRELQVRFLLGWLRTTDQRQRCRVLFCSNPPTVSEGEWIVRWFAPWLDKSYPKPALPGELRWVVMIPGQGERWVDGPEPIEHGGKLLQPLSRTFIPSRVGDNRYLVGTNYERQLQALPEPFRSQMLYGDFSAGRSDDEWQVIPSAWVKAAMDRWKPEAKLGAITSVGCDPTRGGDDDAIVALRRGWRFDPLICVSKESASHGGKMAKKVLDVCGEVAPVHVDVIGVGASTMDHLSAFIGRRAVAVNFAMKSPEKDQTGNLKFVNVRAAGWWRMREALAPERIPHVALPPDTRLAADLCAPRYALTARGIQVEDKDDIRKRLGRSPDRGDAVVLAAFRTPLIVERGEDRGEDVRVHRAVSPRSGGSG